MDHFESLLENTLEQKLFSWLPTLSSRQEIIQQIISVLKSQSGKGWINDLIIHVSAADYPIWFNNQMDLVNLSQTLMEIGQKMELPISSPPAFHIFADSNMQTGQITIQTTHPAENTADTQLLGHPSSSNAGLCETNRTDEVKEIEKTAYLTNSDSTVFMLDKTVTNIGRKEGNDIVISDQRVSRQHAQIRRSLNSYVIFDLNSTSGTFVNERKIQHHRLISGDVISFGGIVYIFFEEDAEPEDDITKNLQGKTIAPPPISSKSMDDLV